MVAIKFYVLLIVVFGESKESLVPQAILQLVQSNYGERPVLIEVFYNSRKVKILDETLTLLSSVKQLKVTPINITEVALMDLSDDEDYCNTINICRRIYSNDAIFLFDTLINYQILKERFLEYQYYAGRSNLNHLVHCGDASQENINKIISRNTYESFLLDQNHQVSLHAMTMFTRKQCRPERLVEFNQFSSLERKWKTEKFIIPRIQNFHGCTLWIEFAEKQMPFLKIYRNEDKTFPEGVIIDMLNALSTHYNFTYLYDQAAEEYFSEPPTLELKKPDFLIGESIINGFHNPSSYPIYSASDVCVVPPGELYTSWEKLFMPFDRPTWMCLGTIFAAAFLVILLLKAKKFTSLHEFIIGSNMTTPTLNVVAIFMGIGQIVLPQRNVSRFFFMVFILFSLIMRTAYQGKYFEFLTSDMRRKPIQTIEELKEKNFTAIVDITRCLDFDCESDLLAG